MCEHYADLGIRLADHGPANISILLKSREETRSYRISSAASVFGVSRALAPVRRATPRYQYPPSSRSVKQ